MSKKIKICVATGTRAEYGLLYLLMKGLRESPEFELQVLVTGMHLSPEFGSTYKDIEKDGFTIDKKVEMLLSSDTPRGISKSMGVGLVGFADAIDELSPDLVVVLGDRFEAFAFAVAALNACVPIAHLHGGEATEGAIDEAMRHSITKMAQLHFTATEEYRGRVIQLGEQPDSVFNVGAPGIDNIKKMKLLGRADLEKDIGFKFLKKNLLITYHPETFSAGNVENDCRAMLDALAELEDTGLIFTMPNADAGGRVIVSMIDEFVNSHKDVAVSFKSMGQLRYLSSLQYVDAVVGNSSSGIIEAPSFAIGTINIGNRQKGRVRTESIIDCGAGLQDIKAALSEVFSDSFKQTISKQVSPYGDGNASDKILEILKNADFSGGTAKSFYNIAQSDLTEKL